MPWWDEWPDAGREIEKMSSDNFSHAARHHGSPLFIGQGGCLNCNKITLEFNERTIEWSATETGLREVIKDRDRVIAELRAKNEQLNTACLCRAGGFDTKNVGE